MGRARILHWNIHMWRDPEGGSNVDAVVDLISEVQPDAVTLVEVDEMWEDRSQLAEVAARTGYAWVFVPAFEFGEERPTGGFGNAVLTRAPILMVQQRHLVWPVPPYDGTEPSEARTLALVKVGIDGGLWVGATHLPRNDSRVRAEACATMLGIASRLDSRWIICGDFNMPAAAWLGRHGRPSVAPAVSTPTYPTHAPIEAIDYCLVGAGCRAQADVQIRTGSDHLPLTVAVSWG